MDIALQVENLWKQYRLGTLGHGALWRDLQSWWARRRGREDPNLPLGAGGEVRRFRADRLWALQEVSLTVRPGEVVGIIGRNGAGKSTLLKLIARVTAPTRGLIKIKGRVASLLEVGTGFHHELTGRENVYLNGAILGMSIAEIRRKFDRIVAFAGLEEFIDTPIKRYSSGMYVRLAFAVAAHLDPEILVVDEVLAAGDAGFQKKCLGTMGRAVGEGRTILLVSHNLKAIHSLCQRTLVLEQGRVIADGPTAASLETYRQALHRAQIEADSEVHNPHYRRGTGTVRFTAVDLLDGEGRETCQFAAGDTVRLRFAYEVGRKLDGLAILVALRSGETQEIIASARQVITREPVAAGQVATAVVEFPSILLRPGEYPVYARISDLAGAHANFDVVDGLTPPLIIWDEGAAAEFDPDLGGAAGYVSLPSRLLGPWPGPE